MSPRMPGRLPRRILLALRSFVRHGTAKRERDEELEFHFEQVVAHEAAQGASVPRRHRKTLKRS